MKKVLKGIVIVIYLISALTCFYSFKALVVTLFSIAFGAELEKGVRFLAGSLGAFLLSGACCLVCERVIGGIKMKGSKTQFLKEQLALKGIYDYTDEDFKRLKHLFTENLTTFDKYTAFDRAFEVVFRRKK